MFDMEMLSEFLDTSIPIWRENPVQFFEEVLNFEPDDWQIEVASDVKKNNRVAVKSGQGVGKTAFEAAVFLWFLLSGNLWQLLYLPEKEFQNATDHAQMDTGTYECSKSTAFSLFWGIQLEHICCDNQLYRYGRGW